MGGVAELVDRRDGREAVATLDETASVTRKGRRIARHRDDDGHLALGKLAGLRLGALTRRMPRCPLVSNSFVANKSAPEIEVR